MRLAIFLCAGLVGCGISGPGASDDDGQSSTANVGSPAGPSSGATGGNGGSSSGNGSGAGGNGSGSGTGSASTTGGGGMGDPNCYSEPVQPSADIADVVSSYGGAGYKDQVIEALDRRWPAGAFLLTEQKNDPYWGQFSDASSWSGMVSWLDTLVHEETHLFNAYHAQGLGEAHSLYFRSDLILYLPAEQGFARSEIMTHLPTSLQNSTYATTYLTGSQGQRQFNALLDEASCYCNEIPGMAAFGEFYTGGVSLRDGSAAFLVFMATYLRVARTNHPSFYSWAQSQPAYVDAVRLLWLRTHFFYEAVGDLHPNLGINDATYRTEAHRAENLAEIGMFIGRQVGDSACLLD